MILEMLGVLSHDGVIEARAQDDALSCYAPLLQKQDGAIDWSAPALEIDRQIRALNPWPGTFIEDFKIKAAALVDAQTDAAPGTVLNKAGHVACGGGSVIAIQTVQPAGKKAMDFASALNGGYVRIGEAIG